ncbi:type II toxin-antitoxin system RelE family toxin [Candidatus Nitrospira bockiana]
MAYTVLLRPASGRDLAKLPLDIRSRVTDVLFALEHDPRPPGVTKLAGGHDVWRVRVGSYRILFEIDDPAQTVLVLRIAHRRDAYR